MHLQDEKGYIAQINCSKILSVTGKLVLAGEDGLISISGQRLPKFVDEKGFLLEIEDVDEISEDLILVINADAYIGVYKFNKDEESWSLLGNKQITRNDCFYSLRVIDDKSFEIYETETGAKYYFLLDAIIASM